MTTKSTTATTTTPQVTWFEIHTDQPDRSMEFFGGLFGWSFEPMGDGSYHEIQQGEGTAIGGGLADSGGAFPNTLIPCVQVPDVAATAERAIELGGAVVAPPNETPTGVHFAYLTDRDGSTFGVWTPPS